MLPIKHIKNRLVKVWKYTQQPFQYNSIGERNERQHAFCRH
jgi:hypothetical protein